MPTRNGHYPHAYYAWRGTLRRSLAGGRQFAALNHSDRGLLTILHRPTFVNSWQGGRVPRKTRFVLSRLSGVIALSAAVAYSVATGMAQRTVVENKGAGGKIETDYNASEKVTEMRTLGADGKLQQKVAYEYLPGYYVAQQTNTSYWPNGNVRRVAHNTYDESANFTGEVIELFDESGKRIAGHKLTHDPWTGLYRCSEWNQAARDYRTVECPAGEDEGGEAKAKTFTYDEVMHYLEAARTGARQQQKISRMQPATLVRPPIIQIQKVIGLVLPAQLRPGERVSGSVVENPDQYSDAPEVTVTRVALPFESSGEASRLSGWLLEMPGEKSQRADGPISVVVPLTGSALNVTFRQAGNAANSVSKALTLAQPEEKPPTPQSFQAPALCMKGALCMVSGPFGGDNGKTFAAFEERPATIVAETTDAAYIGIPDSILPGARPMFIAEGPKVVALPVVVGEVSVRNNHRELTAGQTLIMFPVLDGPADMPDSQWRPGNFPASNFTHARRLIPDFQLPGANPEVGKEPREQATEDAAKEDSAEESDEAKGGEILLIVKNDSPEQVSLRSSKNEMLVFRLSQEAFRRGEFKYDLLVEAKKPGKVEVRCYALPFLAPITGQEFSVKASGR